VANLLADPINWKSWQTVTGDNHYAGPPSEYWDAATSSYYYYAEQFGRAQVSMLLVPNAQGGDVLAGEFEALTASVVTEAAPTLTAYDADGLEMWHVTGVLGVRVPFSGMAVTGMQLATAVPDPEQFLYTGESRIYVAQPPVPVAPGPVYVVPHHLRAYSGYDTPLALGVRCDAAASAAGEVTWIHPASIARQHRPGVYRVKVVSSLRGVIGDGLLEVV